MSDRPSRAESLEEENEHLRAVIDECRACTTIYRLQRNIREMERAYREALAGCGEDCQERKAAASEAHERR